MRIAKLGLVVLGLALSLFALDAFAARPYSANTIYLDANNNIIGQQAAFCNNVTYHGGNIDPNNPYKVIIQGGCGDPLVSCVSDYPNGVICKRVGANYGVRASYFNFANGFTLKQFCETMIMCESIEPDLAYGWGFTLSPGWE
jgi:hypothetical protein